MGCGVSKANYHVDEHRISAPVWRAKETKKQSLTRYFNEGSIPVNCSDEMLELRVFLDDPEIVSQFGKFSAEIGCSNIISCWCDILEFKYLSEQSIDLKFGKALEIYHNYLGPLGIELMGEKSRFIFNRKECDIIQSILDTIKSRNPFEYTEELASNSNNPMTQLSSHLLDKVLIECLNCMYSKIFIYYKETDTYKEACVRNKSYYNQVNVDDFLYYEAIGRGTYGFVIHCVKKTTGKHYAMKIQTKRGLLDSFVECPVRVTLEKDAVASCHHPFIVSMDYALQTNALVLMAMDLGTCKYINNIACL